MMCITARVICGSWGVAAVVVVAAVPAAAAPPAAAVAPVVFACSSCGSSHSRRMLGLGCITNDASANSSSHFFSELPCASFRARNAHAWHPHPPLLQRHAVAATPSLLRRARCCSDTFAVAAPKTWKSPGRCMLILSRVMTPFFARFP